MDVARVLALEFRGQGRRSGALERRWRDRRGRAPAEPSSRSRCERDDHVVRSAARSRAIDPLSCPPRIVKRSFAEFLRLLLMETHGFEVVAAKSHAIEVSVQCDQIAAELGTLYVVEGDGRQHIVKFCDCCSYCFDDAGGGWSDHRRYPGRWVGCALSEQ